MYKLNIAKRLVTDFKRPLEYKYICEIFKAYVYITKGKE